MAEESGAIELSIIMPCLNEAETLAVCIQKALKGLQSAGCKGEIVVADNGSTDGSQEIVRRYGARVVPVQAKGYGNALRGGIATSQGRFIIMGDADDSYDFSQIDPFVERLRAGTDLVMGCRMPRGGGKIMPGAMPWKHRWIGNPVLSFIGRLFFKCPITDFHCGLRGFSRSAYETMDLQTSGMEFASEMVIKATLLGMKMDEVPITLFKDGRSRPPHLRSWRDGWRHLRFMMLYSPRWLFLYPGFVLMISGLVVGGYLLPQSRMLFGITFDIHTLLLASAATLIGFQAICFAFFTKIFAIMEKLLPPDPKLEDAFKYINLERGLVAGILMLLAGLSLSLLAVFKWSDASFGPLEPSRILRILIPGTTLLMLGFQTIWASFFFSILGLKRK
jgi:glycosyltransferase involved in cell wall biosynthesis